MPNLFKFVFFGSDVARRMKWHGLCTLADAAQTLEKNAAAASPDLNTEREQRKMATRIRQFDEMQAEQKRQERKAAAGTRWRLPATHPVLTRSSGVSLQVSSVIGKMLWKEFFDQNGRRKLYQGQVVSVHSAGKSCHYDFGAGGTATVKYFVQYEDGDTEDMTYADVLRYLIE